VQFFFQLIYSDYAYFDKQIHIKIFCSEAWASMIFGWPTFKIMYDSHMFYKVK
jgi:hypothetical protein